MNKNELLINSKTRKIIPEFINLVDVPNKMCANSSINIMIDSNLPLNTNYSVNLYKGNLLVETIGFSNSFTIPIYISPNKVYGTDYQIKVFSGTVFSDFSTNITVGNLQDANFYTMDGYQIINQPIQLCNGTESIQGAKIGSNNNEITNGVSIQWVKDNINVGLNENPITISEAGIYKIFARQGSCEIVSNPISVSYSNTAYSTISPISTSHFCDDKPVNVFPLYNTETATYQWQKDNVDIEGATARIYKAQISGIYSVKVFENNCSVNTSDTPIYFSSSLISEILSLGTKLCGNSPIYLGGGSVGIFQSDINGFGLNSNWQRDKIDLPNENKYFYNAYLPGKYRLKISQGSCTSYSKEIEIINDSKWDKPKFNIYTNNNLSVCSGEFPVYWTTNGATLYKDGQSIFTGGNYTISQSGTYTLVNLPENSCSISSEPLIVNFETLVPIITCTRTVLCGANDVTHIFYYNQMVNSNFSFQWQRNGIDLPLETNYILQGIKEGIYRLKVTSGSCIEYSNEIVVSRDDNFIFDISNNTYYGDGTQSIFPNLDCTNRLISFKTEVIINWPAAVVGYQWYRNGNEILGENKFFYTSPEAGTYTATITTSSGCNATTNPLTITSDYVLRPTITQSPTNTGASATLTATGCTGTINWYDALSGGANLGTGVTLITPNLNEATFYYTDCTTSDCKSARAKYLVNLNDCTSMYTLKSGDWRDPEIWSCGRIPVETDLITISQGHNIEVLYGEPIIKTLSVSGNLKFENGAGLVLKKD